ncbi:anti-sigma factor [Streptomyces sp. NPDC007084]|uniref:anti-sigma factor n=1 Tax=Streptomyces sp. NPDC007084 TaxID=3154313 RepID=UPI0034565C9E
MSRGILAGAFQAGRDRGFSAFAGRFRPAGRHAAGVHANRAGVNDPHLLMGAYALDALDPGEQTEFERHLRSCPLCATEAEELRETAARLAAATTVRPRREFRHEVLTRVEATRQLPAAGPRTGIPALAGGPHRAARWALAACVAAAVALGGTSVWQNHRAGLEQGRAEQRLSLVTALLAAPDTQSQSLPLTGDATARLVVSHRVDRALFTAEAVPSPGSGRVFELWFNDAGVMRPAGLVAASTRPVALVLDGGVGPASGLGVTVEPAGGSAHPTSTPVALLGFRT